jgi:hypothetical protein
MDDREPLETRASVKTAWRFCFSPHFPQACEQARWSTQTMRPEMQEGAKNAG